MKEHIVEIIVSVIIIVFVIIGIFIMKPYIINMGIEQTKRTEQMEECEHEWVTTSEFTLLSRDGYRIVSKCIKCGKVIR